MRKVFAVIMTVVIVAGWYVSLFGVGNYAPGEDVAEDAASVESAGGFAPIGDRIKLGLDLVGGVSVVMEAETDATGSELRQLMNQTQAVIERRVNEFGLSEPVVTIEGEKRIRVELPGADDADAAISQIGKTAQLMFVMADGVVALDGSHVKNALSARYEGEVLSLAGTYVINLEFTSEGASLFEQATGNAYSGNVGDVMEGFRYDQILIMLDDDVLSAPRVDGPIVGNRAQITGMYGSAEASELAALIRGGALPVTLEEVETNIVGPTLGINALKSSILAGIIGVGLIMVLMVILYRLMGMAANLALLLYVLLMLWVMSLIGAVLTLPGIAGIILGIGMAVDANVIIFARIKEEVLNGKSIRVASHEGFKRAMSTIVDSQITTLIAGIVLYQIGSGSVRGFATTLLIGILASIFTAVVVTQLYVNLFAESRTFGTNAFFGIKEKKEKKTISFIARRKIFYAVSAVIIVVGIAAGAVRGFNLGLDFTGGTMIQFDMGREVSVQDVTDVLERNDIRGDVQHAGADNEQVIIKTVQALDNTARNALYTDFYETFDLDESAMLNTSLIGPSIGAGLRRNAILAVGLATICMLIYIAFRFEWKLGVAAVIALLHDVLVMIAFYGLFHVPINSAFIAGMLTVVGYSINDTIVVFDRIRENSRLLSKNKLENLIDVSINQTMSRSIITSITTVMAIVPLYVLGGSTIREFTIPLLVGIIAGAISSITIASSVYYSLNSMLNKPKYQGK